GVDGLARAGLLAADLLREREELSVSGLIVPAADVREALPEAESRAAATRVGGGRWRKPVVWVAFCETVGVHLGESSLSVSPAIPAVTWRTQFGKQDETLTRNIELIPKC